MLEPESSAKIATDNVPSYTDKSEGQNCLKYDPKVSPEKAQKCPRSAPKSLGQDMSGNLVKQMYHHVAKMVRGVVTFAEKRYRTVADFARVWDN